MYIQVDAEPLVDPAGTRGNLNLAPWRVLERANSRRVVGDAGLGIERQFLGTRLPARTLPDSYKCVGNVRRQSRRISILDSVEYRSPSQWPGRRGALDNAVIGQSLDVVAQHEVAGRNVGPGERE